MARRRSSKGVVTVKMEGKVVRLISLVLVGVMVSTGVSHGQPGDKAMTVFVTAAPLADVTKVDKETETRLLAAIKDAETKRKDLEKSLKAQHGKKREAWPQDAQDVMFDAEEAVALAQADYAYRKVKSEGLADSAEDIRKAILGEGMSGEKNQIRVVPSADEAQLIVEVNGRRSSYSGATGGLMALRDDQFYISFLVKAAPKLEAERFAHVPRTYRLRGFGATVYRLGVPKPVTPWWRFEAYGTMKWGSAANGASKLVEDFIEKNYDAMVPAASR
jgi:hypothetical protein